MKKALYWLTLSLLLCLPGGSLAQSRHGIPDEDFYLMPTFGDGMIIFTSRPPARGMLNICSLDNSLRFLDNDGKELEAADVSDVVKVIIDNTVFLNVDGVFYRLIPVLPDLGIAVKRETKVQQTNKIGAYGMVNETSSIKEYSAMYSDGVSYNLRDNDIPYKVEESIYLYRGNSIFPLSRKGFRKLLPDKKKELDMYFQEAGRLPSTTDEIRALIISCNGQD